MTQRKLLRRVLVANRGEIAVRIVASASRAGTEPVSSSGTASTVSMPSARQVRVIRTAISPRLATRTRRRIIRVPHG